MYGHYLHTDFLVEAGQKETGMGLAGDSLFHPFSPGRVIWTFVSPIRFLNLSPFLQYPEKPGDILNSMPSFLLGNSPVG